MKDNFLTSFGFTDKEYSIYHLLVTHGPLTVADIVSKSNLHRPYAYKTIESLIEKGIVKHSSLKAKKLYVALSPAKVKLLLEEKKDEVVSNLDALEELYIAPHLETTVTTFQGKKGVTAIFADLVNSQKKGDIFYRYTSEKDTAFTDTFLPKDYRVIRDKKGLERFVISSMKVAEGKQKRLERATKVVPKSESLFAQDCIQLIYGNKVAFINIAKVQGIIIDDENLAAFQREIFKLLYKRL
jgi:sugar-specific transcriptional regulator TrmB